MKYSLPIHAYLHLKLLRYSIFPDVFSNPSGKKIMKQKVHVLFMHSLSTTLIRASILVISYLYLNLMRFNPEIPLMVKTQLQLIKQNRA